MQDFDKKKDYYKVLAVDKNADIDGIRANFYEVGKYYMVQRDYETDEAKKASWQSSLDDVLEAYNVLKDQETRAQYDKERATYLFKIGKIDGEPTYEEDDEIIDDSLDEPYFDEEENPVEKRHVDTRQKVKSVEKGKKAKKAKDNADKILRRTELALLAGIIIVGAVTVGVVHNKLKAIKAEKAIEKELEEVEETSLFQTDSADAELSADVNTVSQNDSADAEVVSADANNVYLFTDASDQAQLTRRATAIHTFLENSNVHNISVDEVERAIKFVNGELTTDTEMDAYYELDNVLNIFENYSTATSQATNFAGDVVDENGVHIAWGFDAMLPDDTKHAEFMNETALLFQNVLTSDTKESKIIASKEFLNQQAQLGLGLLVDDTNTAMSYSSLTESEGFIYGLMSQFAAPVIKSALGENYCLTYTDNLGSQVDININTIFAFYNPLDCDGLYDDKNIWNLCTRELIKQCLIAKEQSLALTLGSINNTLGKAN